MTQICTGNPKQLWIYDDPSPEGNIHTEISEEDILDKFYSYWTEKMISLGKQELVTPANCIDDYIILHWASKKEGKND